MLAALLLNLFAAGEYPGLVQHAPAGVMLVNTSTRIYIDPKVTVS